MWAGVLNRGGDEMFRKKSPFAEANRSTIQVIPTNGEATHRQLVLGYGQIGVAKRQKGPFSPDGDVS